MEELIMNKKEREQLIVFNNIKQGIINQAEAALQLKVSDRWIRKKYKRFLEEGDASIVHKNRGKEGNKRLPNEKVDLVIQLTKEEWEDFGPTLVAEKLEARFKVKLSKETVRKIMIKGGTWVAKKQRIRHRKRRERMTIKGILIQLDGSPHDWFEGRAPKCTLLVFIDDATSEILWLEFVKSESHLSVIQATKNYFEAHGLPHKFYVDYGSVFSVNLNNKERTKKTQWERAMAELGVEVVHARSPQAKGRVERANRTLQDRLVKEMRLARVSSLAEGNEFLRSSNFIENYNKQFSVVAAQPGNVHRPVEKKELQQACCLKEKRVLTNDYTATFNKRIFQLEAQQQTIVRPKEKITFVTFLDGTIELWIRKVKLNFREIYARPQKQAIEPIVREYKPHKPSANSRRWAQGMAPVTDQDPAPRRVG